MSAKIISDSRVLPFPADVIFDVLASPIGHVEMDGSGTVRGVASGPERLRDGARFRMKMTLGVPYQMSSTVKEFEENRRIAWAHVGGHRWRYELEEVDGGTRCHDEVRYRVFGGRLIQRLFVRRDVEAIFTYRQAQMRHLFGTPDA